MQIKIAAVVAFSRETHFAAVADSGGDFDVDLFFAAVADHGNPPRRSVNRFFETDLDRVNDVAPRLFISGLTETFERRLRPSAASRGASSARRAEASVRRTQDRILAPLAPKDRQVLLDLLARQLLQCVASCEPSEAVHASEGRNGCARSCQSSETVRRSCDICAVAAPRDASREPLIVAR